MMKFPALRNRLGTSGLIVFWFLFVPVLLPAQPRVAIMSIDTLWYPEVLVNLDITCGGEKRFDVQRSHLTLYENGSEVSTLTFYCPPPDEKCCLSVALVIDGSGSIHGPILDSIKAAAEMFVSGLDGDCDYASVIVFRGYVHTIVPWTNDVQRLLNGIKGIYASGPGALYDGVGRGIEELLNKEGWECQAVVVISDNGFDNASTKYTLQSCIESARANKIRIFPIQVAEGGKGNDAAFTALARGTGGKTYMGISMSNLRKIFDDLRGLMRRHFDYCAISYWPECPDGTRRNVAVAVGDPEAYCGGEAQADLTYTTAFRKDQLEAIVLETVDTRVATTDTARLIVRIPWRYDSLTIEANSIDVVYDLQCMEFLGVDFLGTALEKCSMTVELDSLGAHLVFDTTVTVTAPSILGRFLFKPIGNTSARCNVEFAFAGLRTPCRYFQETGATVEIVPVMGTRALEVPVFQVDAFPNPFGPGAWSGRDAIRVRIIASREFRAVVNLYDARGNRVKTLARGIFPPGKHLLHLGGSGLDNGVYFIVVETGNLRKAVPVVFMK